MTDTDSKQEGLKWLFGQPAYIVLLFAILASIGYGAWFGFPAAIDKIQAGYEKLDESHRAERKEMREDAKATIDKFDSSLREHTQAIEKLSEKIDGKK